ncbi:MAG: hypothetical protein KDB37_17465 [Ilumatobacter sp.]|nr:hypothetical protein [Ilumatobacter sp.]
MTTTYIAMIELEVHSDAPDAIVFADELDDVIREIEFHDRWPDGRTANVVDYRIVEVNT